MPRLEVIAIEQVAEATRLYELADPSGRPLAAWAPGAHVDVTLDTGAVRQYSLCGDPAALVSYRIAVLRVGAPVGRGGSSWLHDNVEVGDQLEVGAPRNTFALPDAEEYVLLAGGIGITPLLAMSHELQRRHASWRLVYGGRSRAAMAFTAELAALDPERVTLVPQDTHGLPDLAEVLEPAPGRVVLCCGPAPMLAAVEDHCRDWPAGSLHSERFLAEAPAAQEGDHSFELELARSGLTLTVGPEETMLEAIRAAGIEPDCSCEQGICGTCETAVLAGAVDHRDQLLTPDEQAANATVMICVSRAAGDRLVLDL